MTTLGSDNEFPKLYLTNDGDDATPAAGLGKLYVDASKVLHFIDDTGADTDLLASGSGLTDPMTTRGDIIIRNTSNVTARKAVGAARTIFVSDGTDPAWQAKPVAASYKRTSGDYTTTSATMVAVDATNLALTITTLARRVFIGLVGTGIHSSTSSISFDIDIDGTLQGAAVSSGEGGLVQMRSPTAVRQFDVSFTYLSDVLSAASHTFKLMWSTAGATATLEGAASSGHAYMQFWVAETLFEV